ncbi:MAG: glycosyltransferase family 87 protein [Candidatus Eisenbacteria bacterium]
MLKHHTVVKGALWLLLLLALVPIGLRYDHRFRSLFTYKPNLLFYDTRIFLSELAKYEKSGVLYDTQQEKYFRPGSPVYKYPPPYAALLTLIKSQRWKPMAQKIAALDLAALAATVFLIARRRRWSPLGLAALLVLVLAWSPVDESLNGPQLEPLLLLLLTAAAFLSGSRRAELGAGAAIGAAAALKVYPGLFALLLVARRRWTALVGMMAGGLITLLLASLVIPPRFAVEYFTRILPHLGGTGLGPENVSLAGTIGRLALLVFAGAAHAAKLWQSIQLNILEECGVPSAIWTTRALHLLVGAVMVLATARAWRVSLISGPLREALLFGAALCLVVFLSPTSWLDYQTLLLLPLLLAIRELPAWSRDRGSWFLLAVAIFLGVLSPEWSIWGTEALTLSLLRAMLSVVVWVLTLRALAAPRDIDAAIVA